MNSAPCPICGNIGDEVGRVTLDSLLRAERRGDIGAGPHYVCTAPECDTIYFGAAGTALFRKADLMVRFGLKEKLAPRPACYCFGHSVESIQVEVEKTGQSTVLASIKSDMADPGCFCERANPTGRCCLSSVRQAVRDAMDHAGVAGLSRAHFDYGPKEAHVGVAKDDKAVRRGIIETVRAVGFTAVTNRIHQAENLG